MSVNCLGYQQITSLSSAQTLTIPAGTEYAIVQAETQACRWRHDGTAPTASIGLRLILGTELRVEEQVSRIQFIEETASAKLNISYYGLDAPTP